MRALTLLVVALLALLHPAAAGDVTWISPVLGNSCNKTCTAGNSGQPPELWLVPVYSNGRELCRLQDDGRAGEAISAAAQVPDLLEQQRMRSKGCSYASLVKASHGHCCNAVVVPLAQQACSWLRRQRALHRPQAGLLRP